MKKLWTLAAALVPTLFLAGCSMLTGTGTASTTADSTNQNGGSTIFIYLGVMVLFFVVMYFIAIRPEKKREKEQKELLSSMTVGDTVLTTSGFYGIVIDITNDTVIVEFGNNKNCRIPMQKAAIVQIEHPEGWKPPVTDTPAEPEKKGLFGLFGKKKEKKDKAEKKES